MEQVALWPCGHDVAFSRGFLGLVPAEEAFLGLGHPAVITVAGLLFVAFIGWRLTPKRESGKSDRDLFEVSAYMTELRLAEDP